MEEVFHSSKRRVDKAEKDFMNSLKANPNQAYVLNYLAYSWIEKRYKFLKNH